MILTLSERMGQLEGSATGRAAAAGGEARVQVDLGVGSPDWAPPREAIEAAHRAMACAVPYGAPGGDPALRRELVRRDTWTRGSTDRSAIVTAGGKEALFLALGTVVSPGDRVVVLRPYWPSFPEQIRAWGGVPTFVDCGGDGLPERAELRRALVGARALIVNTPCNPSGVEWDADRFRELGDWAEKEDVLVLIDAVYAGLGGPDGDPLPDGLPRTLHQRTLVIDSASKRYALAGLRVGWAVGPGAWVDGMRRLQDAASTHPGTPGQTALMAALEHGQAWLETARTRLESRRRAVMEEVRAHPSLGCMPASAGLFVLVDLPERTDATAVARRLLESGGVRLMPGDAFGRTGSLRLALCAGEEPLRRAVGTILAALPGC